MRFRAVVAFLTVLSAALGAGSATASDNPIETRQVMMKSVAAATKAAGEMVKGETPYEAAKAELAMRAIHSAAAGIRFFFPEGSETGNDTEALPSIWENKKDFDARLAKLEADALAAVETTGSLESFSAGFKKVTQNCGGCHEQYRMDD